MSSVGENRRGEWCRQRLSDNRRQRPFFLSGPLNGSSLFFSVGSYHNCGDIGRSRRVDSG